MARNMWTGPHPHTVKLKEARRLDSRLEVWPGRGGFENASKCVDSPPSVSFERNGLRFDHAWGPLRMRRNSLMDPLQCRLS